VAVDVMICRCPVTFWGRDDPYGEPSVRRACGEVAVLEEGLARARAGVVSTVLVGGEAGVGKTRLIREFAEWAGDCRGLIGGCLELGTDGLPFAPFTGSCRSFRVSRCRRSSPGG
jgi:predicted ATPase